MYFTHNLFINQFFVLEVYNICEQYIAIHIFVVHAKIYFIARDEIKNVYNT